MRVETIVADLPPDIALHGASLDFLGRPIGVLDDAQHGFFIGYIFNRDDQSTESRAWQVASCIRSQASDREVQITETIFNEFQDREALSWTNFHGFAVG